MQVSSQTKPHWSASSRVQLVCYFVHQYSKNNYNDWNSSFCFVSKINKVVARQSDVPVDRPRVKLVCFYFFIICFLKKTTYNYLLLSQQYKAYDFTPEKAAVFEVGVQFFSAEQVYAALGVGLCCDVFFWHMPLFNRRHCLAVCR